MEQKAKPKLTGLKVAAVVLLIALLVLPVLYVGSAGPAAAIGPDGQRRLGRGQWERTYGPIIWLRARSSAFHAATDWWFRCWEVVIIEGANGEYFGLSGL